MSNLYSAAKTFDSNRTSLSKMFETRLLLTVLLTAMNVAALVFVGPIVYQFAFISGSVTVAFSILAFALFVSLVHMWSLTLSIWGH